MNYPCCEAYTISCFKKNVYVVRKNIKNYIKTEDYKIKNIDKYKVEAAVLKMMKSLDKLNVRYSSDKENFCVDNMKKINNATFKAEENRFYNTKNYILLSFISVILLDLGIITFRD